MSATTLLLAVTGGVFCGASMIGAVMILFLWWQANRGGLVPNSVVAPRPVQPATAMPQQQSIMSTMPPTAMPPSPVIAAPAMPDPSGTNRVWLDGIGGMVAGQRIMIQQPQVMVGRSGVCDIQLHDPKISRQHAVLRLKGSDYHLEDLNSTGGTYVNGRRVGQQRLRDRDQVRFGDTILLFRHQ